MPENYEEFTPDQLKLLEQYVTTTKGNVFVLKNLPEVIKGALFSKYSRSTLGLRSLLLKDFILNEETAFGTIVGEGFSAKEVVGQATAIRKAQNFYDRILDGYGDDSIGELGGAHLAVEQVSMLAAKAIEDCRIGGSPLEKSTRYIYFDQKVKGEYAFYREPVLMTSAFRDLYLDTCNMLFDTYRKLIPPLTEEMERSSPMEEGASKVAYKAAIRAKVLDCLRGLLPASTLTNMGVYGNGRFFEMLLQKLHVANLAELQDIGKGSYEELSKVIPSFVRRAELGHRHQLSYTHFFEQVSSNLKHVVPTHLERIETVPERDFSVRLVRSTSEAAPLVAGALLYASSDCSLYAAQEYCKGISEEEIGAIFDSVSDPRDNRRHKGPRALEHVQYTFEIWADFGVYRDLQRHRMCTQERQLLTAEHGYYFPQELNAIEMGEEYHKAMLSARDAYRLIKAELPEEAQYIVPMAYNVHWYFHINLRSLQWMCELRSQAAGHPTYRRVAQEMARQVIDAEPLFERFFKYVDFDGYELGRLGQEERLAKKKMQVS
ncbi:MAG: FAD-dependent thymidylate synthase [Verrucomicrobia bacterium]|nr:FAD-dependent thymidylate synthase [Verrucomicrobiota bacterium]